MVRRPSGTSKKKFLISSSPISGCLKWVAWRYLKAVKASSPETVVLMITAFASADSAVEAMKQGAYDYLTKPFQVDEVQLIIRNALNGGACRRKTCC